MTINRYFIKQPWGDIEIPAETLKEAQEYVMSRYPDCGMLTLVEEVWTMTSTMNHKINTDIGWSSRGF